VAVFGVFGRLKIRDGHKHFRQEGMIVFLRPDASFLNMKGLRLDEDFLPDYLVDMPHWRFGLRPRLILVTILDS